MVWLLWWFCEDCINSSHLKLFIIGFRLVLGERKKKGRRKCLSFPKLRCSSYIPLRGRTADIVNASSIHINVHVRMFVPCARSHLCFGITIFPTRFWDYFSITALAVDCHNWGIKNSVLIPTAYMFWHLHKWINFQKHRSSTALIAFSTLKKLVSTT